MKQPFTVTFSHEGGFYAQPITVSLQASGEAIFYTLDGEKPNLKGTPYKGPISITTTTTVRAFAKSGNKYSPVATNTYFVGETRSTLPVVALSMSPSVLFHPERGIMQDGPNANLETPGKLGANFWSRKEYSCNVEIFETEGRCVYNNASGFRLFGGYSRLFPQKSMVIVARPKYGKKRINYPIFGEKGFKKYKYLVLRNAGSDWNGAHFRDEMMSELVDNWGIEKQDQRPAVVYLNGKYWGIYYFRDKINPKFLADHCNVDKDSIDFMEHKETVRKGDDEHYKQMVNYIRTHDMADPQHYAWVKKKMDVVNFIDFQVAQIYCDNTDAGGNIRYWRPKRPGGKWRWILYDTDWGFGLHNKKAYSRNSLAFFTDPNGPEWPNPEWSTLLLRSLLKNKEFQEQFVNRMCDRLNTDFASANVKMYIKHFTNVLTPEMDRHLTRWKLGADEWSQSIDNMYVFAEKRPEYLYYFMHEQFQTGELADLQLESSVGGSIRLNGSNIEVDAGKAFRGKYFENVPVQLEAVPEFGYKFVGWEGTTVKERHVAVNLKSGKVLQLKAVFETYNHPLLEKVIINEVCAYNKHTGDWLEIHNKSDEAIDLSGWNLKDDKHIFTFEKGIVPADGYLVICEDLVAFSKVYPEVKNVVEGLNFGLDKSMEQLSLFTYDGAAVDSISYTVEPLASGYTIDLLLPSLNNASPSNWAVHPGKGSPGEANPMYFAQIVGAKKDFWLRIGLGICFTLALMFALYYRKKSYTK